MVARDFHRGFTSADDVDFGRFLFRSRRRRRGLLGGLLRAGLRDLVSGNRCGRGARRLGRGVRCDGGIRRDERCRSRRGGGRYRNFRLYLFSIQERARERQAASGKTNTKGRTRLFQQTGKILWEESAQLIRMEQSWMT